MNIGIIPIYRYHTDISVPGIGNGMGGLGDIGIGLNITRYRYRISVSVSVSVYRYRSYSRVKKPVRNIGLQQHLLNPMYEKWRPEDFEFFFNAKQGVLNINGEPYDDSHVDSKNKFVHMK